MSLAEMGDEVAGMRRAVGMSQATLAAKAGYSGRTMVTRIELGVSGSIDALERLARVLAPLSDERVSDMVARLAEVAGIDYEPRPPAVPQVGFPNPLRACAGVGPDKFFAPDPRPAVAICRTQCPVMEGCLRYATAAGEPAGVWGGCTATERDLIADRWDGTSPLVSVCVACDRGFVPLLDGDGEHCPSCR